MAKKGKRPRIKYKTKEIVPPVEPVEESTKDDTVNPDKPNYPPVKG